MNESMQQNKFKKIFPSENSMLWQVLSPRKLVCEQINFKVCGKIFPIQITYCNAFIMWLTSHLRTVKSSLTIPSLSAIPWIYFLLHCIKFYIRNSTIISCICIWQFYSCETSICIKTTFGFFCVGSFAVGWLEPKCVKYEH